MYLSSHWQRSQLSYLSISEKVLLLHFWYLMRGFVCLFCCSAAELQSIPESQRHIIKSQWVKLIFINKTNSRKWITIHFNTERIVNLPSDKHSEENGLTWNKLTWLLIFNKDKVRWRLQCQLLTPCRLNQKELFIWIIT